jgi:hypothetical protein
LQWRLSRWWTPLDPLEAAKFRPGRFIVQLAPDEFFAFGQVESFNSSWTVFPGRVRFANRDYSAATEELYLVDFVLVCGKYCLNLVKVLGKLGRVGTCLSCLDRCSVSQSHLKSDNLITAVVSVRCVLEGLDLNLG